METGVRRGHFRSNREQPADQLSFWCFAWVLHTSAISLITGARSKSPVKSSAAIASEVVRFKFEVGHGFEGWSFGPEGSNTAS